MSDLCQLAMKYRSDKCPQIYHSYTPVYHEILNPLRDTVRSFLEIGIGNIPLMKAFAGDSYSPGASLRMWRDYFPSAYIYGCDIDSSVLFEEERISTFVVDQSDIASLKTVKGEYDIILDDGSHDPRHQQISLIALWPLLVEGGLYIIEDVCILPNEIPNNAVVIYITIVEAVVMMINLLCIRKFQIRTGIACMVSLADW